MLQDFGWGGAIVLAAFLVERALLLGADASRRPVAGWMVAVLVATYRIALASAAPLGHAMGRDVQITLDVLADASVALAVAAAAGLLDLVVTNLIGRHRGRSKKPVAQTSAGDPHRAGSTASEA